MPETDDIRKEDLVPMNHDELLELWPQFKEDPKNQNGILVLSSGTTGAVIGFPDSIIARKVLFDGEITRVDGVALTGTRLVKNTGTAGYHILMTGMEAFDRAMIKLLPVYEVCNIEVFHGEGE